MLAGQQGLTQDGTVIQLEGHARERRDEKVIEVETAPRFTSDP